MNVSNDLLRFIASFEGVSAEAYKDSGGVLTIGVGHTNQDIAPFDKNSVWEPDKIKEVLLLDLESAIRTTDRLLKCDVPQAMYDMSVDLVFNAGNAPTYFRLMNEGDFAGARDQLLRWIYDNGKVQLGLVKRCFARYMTLMGRIGLSLVLVLLNGVIYNL